MGFVIYFIHAYNHTCEFDRKFSAPHLSPRRGLQTLLLFRYYMLNVVGKIGSHYRRHLDRRVRPKFSPVSRAAAGILTPTPGVGFLPPPLLGLPSPATTRPRKHVGSRSSMTCPYRYYCLRASKVSVVLDSERIGFTVI